MTFAASVLRRVDIAHPGVERRQRVQLAKEAFTSAARLAERALSARLHEFLPYHPLRVLDIGTCRGDFPASLGQWLKAQGFRLEALRGIDINGKNAAAWTAQQSAHPDLPLHFEAANFRDFRADKPYDLVCLNAPIIVDDIIIRLASRSLRQDGVLWIRLLEDDPITSSAVSIERFISHARIPAVKIYLPQNAFAGLALSADGQTYPKGPVYLLKPKKF